MTATETADTVSPPITEFRVAQEVVIDAPREKVWEALTSEIDQWWSKRLHHTIGESSLSLEPRVGGSFIERWGDDEGALWGTVIFIRKPEMLRLSGPLGMIEAPVMSVYSYELQDHGDGTLLKLMHHACGPIKPEWHAGYSAGWTELLGSHLKEYVEQGKTRQDVKTDGQTP